MADIRDLPGELNLTLYVGRPTSIQLTWPTSLAGKTYLCLISYGGAAATVYTVVIATTLMTVTLPATDYPGESGPGTLEIRETTGGLTTPIIVGKVNVVRGVTGTGSTAAIVNVAGATTVAVSVNTLPAIYPTFATVSARTSGIVTPTAGNGAYLTTPKIMTWYNGATWDGQVPTFATAAARTTAIPTPDLGMVTRNTAVEALEYWNGSRWQSATVMPTTTTTANRDALITAPYAGLMARTTSPVEQLWYYDGSAWQVYAQGAWIGYTPTLSQSNTITVNVNYAKYRLIGKTVQCQGQLTCVTAGTAAVAVNVTLPPGLGTVFPGLVRALGVGVLHDVSANAYYRAIGSTLGASIQFLASNSTAANYLGADMFTAALANSDEVSWDVSYEIA